MSGRHARARARVLIEDARRLFAEWDQTAMGVHRKDVLVSAHDLVIEALELLAEEDDEDAPAHLHPSVAKLLEGDEP